MNKSGPVRSARARRLFRACGRHHRLRTRGRVPSLWLGDLAEMAPQRPRAPHELIAALRSALEETQRLSRLAQDLLPLAHLDPLETTAAPTAPEATELRPLLQGLITRYRQGTSHNNMILDCADGIAARAHPGDCARAIGNLLDNALQHGRPPILIRVCPTAAGRPNHSLAIEVEVRDHGPGFTPELAQAFDRLSQSDPAHTHAGAGLGLAITAALAARNGGTVTATNYPANGAGLILILPAATTTSTAT
jgi:signal transduction histidine kinase